MAINLTDENFEKEIKGTDKLALVDFYATWCEPCTMLSPVLDKVAEELKDKLVLMKANLDAVPKTAGKFGVESIPTVIIFKNGEAVSGFVGFAGEEAIKSWITEAENDAKNPTTEKKDEAVEVEPDIAGAIERYDNYATSNGFHLNPDKTAVERVVKGLFMNEKKYGKKYCPCRRVTGNVEEDAKKICPCVWHKEELEKDGHCLCNLYVK